MKRTLAHGVYFLSNCGAYFNGETPAGIETDDWTADQLRTIADDIEAREREAQRGKT